MECYFCGGKILIKGKVRRQDTCGHCHRDLRSCRQCNYYDQNAYNECREVSAERIIEKERANFCDYFALKGTKGGGGSHNRVKEAKMALEDLFRKK